MSEREAVKGYTKNDFDVCWFSGRGPGGQHRNKHQNCCRITHIATGLRAQSTRHRSRQANQRAAFQRLAGMLLAYDQAPTERRSGRDVVRTYHFERDEVIDHGSGLRRSTSRVMDGDLEGMREGAGAHPLPKTGR